MNPTADEPDLDALEAAIGVSFRDRRLLLAALTHRSHINEVERPDSDDNERLEFLGDALVDFVAAAYLYRLRTESREGDLTAIRAALVCERALARYARQLSLGRHIRLGRGEAASGGRDRPALLCDAFEALVGALYLDRGLAAARRLVMRFLECELESLLAEQQFKDAKSRFQEHAQHRWQITPHYETVAESGPDHAKHFEVRVHVASAVWGTGEGPSKSSAARRAAVAALRRLEEVGRPVEWSQAGGGEALPLREREPDRLSPADADDGAD